MRKLTKLETLEKAVVDTKAAFEAAAYDYYDYDAADAWDDAEDAVPAAWTDYRKALQELEDYLEEITKYYRKKELQPLFPWTPDLPMGLVSISEADKANGSPKKGDMIAYNPKEPTDFWLVAEKFFIDNYIFVKEQDNE